MSVGACRSGRNVKGGAAPFTSPLTGRNERHDNKAKAMEEGGAEGRGELRRAARPPVGTHGAAVCIVLGFYAAAVVR